MKLINILVENYEDQLKLGSVSKDPTSGAITKLTGIDQDTGKISWDVNYETDLDKIHAGLITIAKLVKDAKPGSEDMNLLNRVNVLIKKVELMMAKEGINESSNTDTALANKAKATGISKTILRQVYEKGLAAWKRGHRPGASQHQWAMARVNSFVTGKGQARKVDASLWKRAKKSKKKK
jgi:hypothetical protein